MAIFNGASCYFHRMVTTDPVTRARENLPGIVSILITGIWLAALISGYDWWLPFMLVGYIIIVPLIALLFGDQEDIKKYWDDEAVSTQSFEPLEAGSQTQDNALETLRTRYAKGELTDEQFERKVDQLLETETLEDIEDANREPESEQIK